MNKTINRWQFWGFIFTSILGVLLHFAYEWSGKNPLVALFSGVNESTWEHMKILFFPMFIFGIFQAYHWKEKPTNFWCIKLYGMLLGLALIPIIFYTFNGALGPSPDWYNIAIYFQAAAAAYLLEARLFKESSACRSPAVALVLLFVIAAFFILFTWFPPQIPLFQDPTTKTYGI